MNQARSARSLTALLAVTLSTLSASPLQASERQADAREIIVSEGRAPQVDFTIANQSVSLDVMMTMPGIVAIAPATARQLGLRRGWRKLTVNMFGIGKIRGPLVRDQASLAGLRVSAPVGILPMTNPAARGAVGLSVLPEQSIRFRLAPPAAGEATRQWPLLNRGAACLARDAVELPVLVCFDVADPVSRMNAGARIALVGSGLARPAGSRFLNTVRFGLQAQFQPVTLSEDLLGRRNPVFLARTDEDILAAPDGTIVVVGSKAGAPPPALTLGRDALAGCSSLTIDRAAMTLSITCRPGSLGSVP